jgi:hypothetical protein
MKKFLCLITLCCFILWGCFETNQDVTINADGSGVFKTTMNIGGMFDMIEMLKAMDTSSNEKMSAFGQKAVDTMINMKDIVDTSTTMSAEEKRLLREGTVHMKINPDDKEFIMSFSYPYKNFSDLNQIFKLQQQGKTGLSMLGKDKKGLPGMDDENAPPIGEMDKAFTYTWKDGLLERTIDKSIVDKMIPDEQKDQMEQAGEMLDQMKMNMSFHLPRPVKSFTGDRVKLSADKKTVTINTTYKEMFEAPKSLNYHIEY